MPILYKIDDKDCVAYVASGLDIDLAAQIMGLAPGTWREITDEEAAAMQPLPPSPPEPYVPTPEELKQAEANQFLLDLLEGFKNV